MALLGEKISLITTAADRYAALAVAWIRPTASGLEGTLHGSITTAFLTAFYNHFLQHLRP